MAVSTPAFVGAEDEAERTGRSPWLRASDSQNTFRNTVMSDQAGIISCSGLRRCKDKSQGEPKCVKFTVQRCLPDIPVTEVPCRRLEEMFPLQCCASCRLVVPARVFGQACQIIGSQWLHGYAQWC